jgi:hypothetical protein
VTDARAEFIKASVWHGSLGPSQEILAAHPDIAGSDIYTAAILGRRCRGTAFSGG